MRRLLLVLGLVGAALAWAGPFGDSVFGGPVIGRPKRAAAAAAGGTTFYATFTSGSPACLSSPYTPATGPNVTIARASNAYLESPAGTLTQCSSNQGRSDSAGVFVELGSTNYWLQSENISLPTWGWVLTTVTANQTTAPDGENTADKVVWSDGSQSYVNQDMYTYKNVWFYAKTDTAGATVHARTGYSVDSEGCSCCTYPSPEGSFSLSSAWARKTWAGAGVSCDDWYTHNIYLSGDPAPQTNYIWGAMAGSATATGVAPSYIATTGTSAARPADVLTVTTTDVLVAAAGSFDVTVQPAWGYSVGVDTTVFSEGNVVLIYDSANDKWKLTAGGQSASSAAQSFAANTSIRLQGKWATGSVPCITVGVAAEVCGASNSTTFTPNANIYIGSNTSSGAQFFGSIKNMRLCDNYGACT